MTDPAEKLIETAVRPLAGQGEDHLAAIALLAPMVKGNEADHAATIHRWDQVDAAGKRRIPWQTALYILTALVSIIILTDGAIRLFQVRDSVRALRSIASPLHGFSAVELPSPGKPGLTAEQRLLLEGDLSKRTRTARAKALWDTHPENPAYFIAYTREHLSEHDQLPQDFLKTAAAIDPGNSWYYHLAAAVEAKDAVKRQTRTAKQKADNTPTTYDILDPKKLETALALLHQGRDLPRCDNHMTGLLRQRISLLDQSDPFKRLASSTWLMAMPAPDAIAMRRLGEIIEAKAAVLASEKQTSAFKDLVADWDALVRKSIDTESPWVVEGLVTSVNIMASRGLAAGASRLGLTEESERLAGIDKRIRERADTRTRTPSTVLVEGVEFSRKSALVDGMNIPMTGRMVLSPPPVSEAAVKPGRLTDHSYFAALVSTGAFVILAALTAILSAYVYLQRGLMRKLAVRFGSLLSPIDWAWILVTGVLLPFSYVLGIYLFTPLGCRDLSLKSSILLLPSLQFFGLALLVPSISLLAAGWRLRKRAAAFDFGKVRIWPGWAAIISVILSVPLIGATFRTNTFAGFPLTIGLLALIPLWLLWMACLAFFGKGRGSLPFTAIVRAALPACALAMLLMVSLIPLFRASALASFKQDTFMSLDPAYPSATRYEYQVAQQLTKELREAVDGTAIPSR